MSCSNSHIVRNRGPCRSVKRTASSGRTLAAAGAAGCFSHFAAQAIPRSLPVGLRRARSSCTTEPFRERESNEPGTCHRRRVHPKLPTQHPGRAWRSACDGSAGSAAGRGAHQLPHAGALPGWRCRVLLRLQEPSWPVPASGRPGAPCPSRSVRRAEGESAVPVQQANAPRTHRCGRSRAGQIQCSQGRSKASSDQACIRQAPCR
jgi:hypothetical protein